MENRVRAARKRRETRTQQTEGGSRSRAPSRNSVPHDETQPMDMVTPVRGSPLNKRPRFALIESDAELITLSEALGATVTVSRESKRANNSSANAQCALAALPDDALHEIFDHLYLDGVQYHRQERAALSQTCRRLHDFYRHHYVTTYSGEIELAKAGPIMEHFPRLSVVMGCTLYGGVFDPSDEVFSRMVYLWIQVDGHTANLPEGALCDLARACPSLKTLSIEYKNEGSILPSLLGSHETFSMPLLEGLELYWVNSPTEDLVRMFAGVQKLRELTVVRGESFFEIPVMHALPHSIERIHFDNFKLGCKETARIIGQLPRLKVLDFAYRDGEDWLKWLPLAACLQELYIFKMDAENEKMCALLTSMTHLRSLDLHILFGKWNGCLSAISNLPLLENLDIIMVSKEMDKSELEKSMLSLGKGPIRHSLVNCTIEFAIDDEKLRRSLLCCFQMKLQSSFEKRGDGIWKLIFRNEDNWLEDRA